MNRKDTHQDPLFAAIPELRTYDVTPARAQRLRERCHRGLRLQHAARVHRLEPTVWPRIVRIVAGAWCVLYVLETIRRAAAVYMP
jgi:hypothetical protein